MSVISRGMVGVSLLAIALGAGACGTEDAPVTGAPAPPEATAETDCDQLEADPARDDPLPEDPLPYGFNDHAGLVGSLPIAEDAELQERAGSTLWRVAVDWRFAEPEPDQMSFETLDAIYCEGLTHGIRPILHITGTPDWAADSGGCPVVTCLYPPTDAALEDLRELAALIAARYPRAAAIEAWNEPNLATFWARPDPAGYVDVLTAIDDGVKSTGSTIPVLGGALSNTSRTDEARSDFGPFLRRMLADGAAEHLDGVSIHPYPVAPIGSREDRFGETMARLRRLLDDAGQSDLPIWVTEVGLPLGPEVSPGDQARTLHGIYDRLGRDPRIAAVIFHTLLEGGGEAGSDGGFGWIVPSGAGQFETRPVYDRFAAGA